MKVIVDDGGVDGGYVREFVGEDLRIQLAGDNLVIVDALKNSVVAAFRYWGSVRVEESVIELATGLV